MRTADRTTSSSPDLVVWLLQAVVAVFAVGLLTPVGALWGLAAAVGHVSGRTCSPMWRQIARTLGRLATLNGRQAVDGASLWWTDPVRRAQRASAAQHFGERVEHVVTLGASRRANEEMAAFAAEHEAQQDEIRRRLRALGAGGPQEGGA